MTTVDEREHWCHKETICLPDAGVHLGCPCAEHLPLNPPNVVPRSAPPASCGHSTERMYVNGTTGKRYCRECRNVRATRRGHELRGEPYRPPRVAQPPRRHGEQLSPETLARLRAQCACLGCGAVREERPNAQAPATTRIRHRRSCPVRARELIEFREDQRRRRLSISTARRRQAEPDQVATGGAA